MKMSKIIFFGYMFIILIMSLIPGDTLADVEMLYWDKIIHFIEYFIFGVLGIKAFSNLKYSVYFIIFFGTSFGFFNEVLQNLIPGRSPSIYDALANFFGVTFGTITSSVNKKYII